MVILLLEAKKFWEKILGRNHLLSNPAKKCHHAVVDPGTKERHQKRISFCRQITTKGKKSEVPYKENHKHLNKQGNAKDLENIVGMIR